MNSRTRAALPLWITALGTGSRRVRRCRRGRSSGTVGGRSGRLVVRLHPGTLGLPQDQGERDPPYTAAASSSITGVPAVSVLTNACDQLPESKRRRLLSVCC